VVSFLIWTALALTAADWKKACYSASVQNSAWYEVAAGGLWIAVKQAFSGDGIRAMMESLVKWHDQAKAKGCTMNGPGPTVPPMPISTQLMWGAGIIAGLAVLGLITYGVATKQGPVQIINRIARR